MSWAKVALVTGASRGIGRETARQLLLEGWQVAVNYCRSRQAAEEFAREMSGLDDQLLLVQADVSDRREGTRCKTAGFAASSTFPALHFRVSE